MFSGRQPYCNARRWLACLATLCAVPLYVVCAEHHFCQGGHLAHPPYSLWVYVNDVAGMILFVIAGVLALRSNLRLRFAFSASLAYLLLAWAAFVDVPFEFLVLLFVALCALIGLRRPKQPADPRYCQDCQYDLTGNVSGRCPECGRPVSPQPPLTPPADPS